MLTNNEDDESETISNNNYDKVVTNSIDIKRRN